jgi:histidyl-tRNA synthetase
LGTASDRQQYRQALVDFLTPYKADLDADSQDRLTRNPLRILDVKTRAPKKSSKRHRAYRITLAQLLKPTFSACNSA